MATRFYLPSSGNVNIAPAFAAGWFSTTGADRLPMRVDKQGTSMANKTKNEGTTNNTNHLLRQYISPAIKEQTISGQFKAQALANAVFSGEAQSQILVKVIDSTGALRGTLLDLSTAGSTTWVGSYTNRKFPRDYTNGAYPTGGAALSSVDAFYGDRVVVEIGYHTTGADSESPGCTFGDNNADDQPADSDTGTTQLNPWVEFSLDIIFAPPTVVKNLRPRAFAPGLAR